MGRGKNLSIPPKDELERMYQDEKMSYRDIMKHYGVNTARAVKRWLEFYEIPIRRGTEAVKTQWENNEARKRSIGLTFAEYNRGKPSSRRLSEDEAKSEYTEQGYTLLKREIIEGYSWATLQCEKGHIFRQSFKNKGSRGCPVCKESKGEKAVQDYLEEKGINFVRQYKDNRCSKSRPLPFDFAIVENGKVISMIEYDGEFHYKPIFCEEDLTAQKERDEIKTDFCKREGIPLLRIRYDENIKERLEAFFTM